MSHQLATASNNTDAPTQAEQNAFKGYSQLQELTKRLSGKKWHTFTIKPHVPAVIPTITKDDIQATLMVRRMSLNPATFVKLQRNREIKKKVAKYPVVRSSLHTFSIATGHTQWEQDNVFLGRMPDRVLIALMYTDNFNSTLGRYPFAYERLNISQIRQVVNGDYIWRNRSKGTSAY